MDKFPEDFNKTTLAGFRESKQKQLVCSVRKIFHDTIVTDCHGGSQVSKIKFPKNLNREYRIIICNELLAKFNKIDVTFDCDDARIKSFSKTFYSLDDEFLSEYVSNHKNIKINIESVTVRY